MPLPLHVSRGPQGKPAVSGRGSVFLGSDAAPRPTASPHVHGRRRVHRSVLLHSAKGEGQTVVSRCMGAGRGQKTSKYGPSYRLQAAVHSGPSLHQHCARVCKSAVWRLTGWEARGGMEAAGRSTGILKLRMNEAAEDGCAPMAPACCACCR